ncbi:MAG: monofunctional biosynthetic peptidoglycan transglycosylase [Gammaproteobacteria bacterium]|nr:monofunctional biosynthetic peptidoglycan transglycosylase [Gammaproteobacteria bacterium]MDH3464429.1 monofunctional biosynthetic peptidoglycan transglycosylase [Gammaproteobacteria bacterium]
MSVLTRVGHGIASGLWRLLLAVLIIDLFYVWQLWHERPVLETGPVPMSRFISDQRTRGGLNTSRWEPIAIEKIPAHVVRAVLIAEDGRFYSHAGFDFTAIQHAINVNMERRRIAFGASTISQQTAKNLYLTPERSWLRKWHEALLTVTLEVLVSKRRILEIYLNTAQFGRGVFGVQAAARHYWSKPVALLSLRQAAELAAALPSPGSANPNARSAFFRSHADKIYRRLQRVHNRSGEI